ncbi:hypothetical protein EI42_01200 [Thermosporothrix hazakensis]|jgi:hypothetical protein|uniref:Uncharacterized protein n=2 Tax=Thermosporothrix TaxID=768650 RepID=A0A326UM79_THEHA|nr:DurN family substrate-assisted peptide maturase [Thermosporothrix hazakensis]PZW34363.1 hypothetical protein EI42_01200 [Thermosporothrix hazakensis]BBH85485.1 hypothetical protein KTC_02360 [Thermosporothrix sp. COM3]GCE46088.1 hypothetical protein KTH_09570 [Thermosporothrix hazakensis]
MDKPMSTTNVMYDGDEIRQIQMLLVLLSHLPPDSMLREIFEHAMALPHDPWAARVTPVTDTSFYGLKTWLESLWARDGLSADEQRLVDWQRSGKNIEIAVRELKAIQQLTGFKFGIVALNPGQQSPMVSQ